VANKIIKGDDDNDNNEYSPKIDAAMFW
jgi:hypothetical protein